MSRGRAAPRERSASLPALGKRLARVLAAQGTRIVFAESCTGGLCASTLAAIPGISRVFCGSLVTYRDDAKARWLGVSRRTLARSSAVSAEAATEMAQGALRATPEADLAVSITGYLGPSAPRGELGKAFVGLALRAAGARVPTLSIRELALGRGGREKLRAFAAREALGAALGIL